MSRAQLQRALSHRIARQPILRSLRDLSSQADADLWCVGGYVRDVAMGRTPGDSDFVVPRGIERLLEAIEHAHGTRGFKISKRGITTWRTRIQGQELDLVDASTQGLQSDLLRRDLTINAVAFNATRMELLDPTGGLKDLDRKRLRSPRKGVFAEDPLRSLRLARFAGAFPDFALDAATVDEAKQVASVLTDVSVERVRYEFDKILKQRRPAVALRHVAAWSLLSTTLPELEPMQRCVAGPERPDVWEHTLQAIDQTARLGRRRIPFAERLQSPEFRHRLHWTLLLHDIAKPSTLEWTQTAAGLPRPTFHGHENVGAKDADRLMDRLKQPVALKRDVCSLIRWHLRPGMLADGGSPPRGMRRLVREADALLPELLLHAAADALGSGAKSWQTRWRTTRRALFALAELHKSWSHPSRVPLLGGKEIMRITGLPGGAEIGRWLAELSDAQLAGTVQSAEEAERWLLEALSQRR